MYDAENHSDRAVKISFTAVNTFVECDSECLRASLTELYAVSLG